MWTSLVPFSNNCPSFFWNSTGKRTQRKNKWKKSVINYSIFTGYKVQGSLAIIHFKNNTMQSTPNCKWHEHTQGWDSPSYTVTVLTASRIFHWKSASQRQITWARFTNVKTLLSLSLTGSFPMKNSASREICDNRGWWISTYNFNFGESWPMIILIIQPRRMAPWLSDSFWPFLLCHHPFLAADAKSTPC